MNHPLAFLSLTTPWMLAGLLLVGLPVAAHLLHRRSRRTVVFPTTRLLREAVAAQSRLFRLRRWLLLLLRALAVALIVMAFARPVWLSATTGSANAAGDAAGTVLVIDASASVRQVSEGVSRWQQVVAAAQRTLRSLRPGTDVANVVIASADPHAVFARLSPNLSALIAEVGQLEPTYDRADLRRALAVAGEQLARHEGLRHLVILSDRQATNWQEVLSGRDLPGFFPPRTRVTLWDDDGEPAANVSLSAPRVSPPLALSNRPLQILVRVTNHARGARSIRVELVLDGELAGVQTASLAAGEQTEIAFEATVSQPGEHAAVLSIPPDGLDADNRAYLVFSVSRRLPVVVVSDDSDQLPGSAAYFLTRALAPHGNEADRFEVRHVRPRRLAPEQLTGAAAVLVGYVAEFPAVAAQVLDRFVRDGGGVLWLCGEGAVSAHLRTLESAGGEDGLLPWLPASPRNLAAWDEALAITGGTWQSSLLSEFDEQSQMALSRCRFFRVLAPGASKPDAQTLLTFSDGTPALSERRVGSGRLLLANFSPSVEASDLGKHGTFVALVQSLVQQLRPGGDSAPTGIAGESYHFPQAVPVKSGVGALEVLDPLGRPARAAVALQGDGQAVHITRPTLPGIYLLRSAEATLSMAAVNVDPREGNLATIDRRELSEHLRLSGLQFNTADAVRWDAGLPSTARPLWGWMILAAMATLALELSCVGWWRR